MGRLRVISDKILMQINFTKDPVEILEWFIEPDDFKYLNKKKVGAGPMYKIWISSYNENSPHLYHVKITVEMVTKINHGIYSFRAITSTLFKDVPIDYNVDPTPEFIFLFVEIAGLDFYKVFQEKSVNTLEQAIQVFPPNLAESRQAIQKSIDHWNFELRKLPLN